MSEAGRRAAGAVTALAFACNRARAEELRDHLVACDAAFTPPLSRRVAIPDYAVRLVAGAERFEAWAGSELVGLVAAYCNAPDRAEAFVTSVSVVSGWTRRGIARRLMQDAIGRARALGFLRIALRADRDAPALHLYRDLGFRADRTAGPTLALSLDLRPEA